jgi:NADH-quinone oxidoreductase subunit J
MIQQVAFLVLTLVTLGGALGVVRAKSVFVSALWLILSFIGVSGMYVLLEAGFLAVIQLLIYVGAISVLILFAVMLTHNVMERTDVTNDQWALGLMVAGLLFAALAVLGFRSDWPLQVGNVVPSAGLVLTAGEAADVPGAVTVQSADGTSQVLVPGTTARIGRAFMTEFLLPFEVASAILLVALIGAIVIARE